MVYKKTGLQTASITTVFLIICCSREMKHSHVFLSFVKAVIEQWESFDNCVST